MGLGKFRNEDLSVYYFIKGIEVDSTTHATLGSVVSNIVDSYPFNEIESKTLVVPCISVEVSHIVDDGGELGASWYRRTWNIDVFATTDTQRDEIGDKIFQALDNAIPIKDFAGGFRKETGLSLLGTPLRIIEYAVVESRDMRPSYAFNSYQRVKYWRTTISFDTVTTNAS